MNIVTVQKKNRSARLWEANGRGGYTRTGMETGSEDCTKRQEEVGSNYRSPSTLDVSTDLYFTAPHGFIEPENFIYG